MPIIKKATLLLIFAWAVSFPLVMYRAWLEDRIDGYVIAEALGAAIVPFLVGFVVLIGYYKRDEEHFKLAVFMQCRSIIALAAVGLILAK